MTFAIRFHPWRTIPMPPAWPAPLLLCVSLSGDACWDQGVRLTDSIPGRKHQKEGGPVLCAELVLSIWLSWTKIMSSLKSDLLFTVMEEKCAPFFVCLFHKQKWNTRCEVICNYTCIKCIWSSGYVWCISLDLVILEHQFLSPQSTKKKSKRQTLPPDTHPRLLLRSVSIGCVTLEEEFCLEDII